MKKSILFSAFLMALSFNTFSQESEATVLRKINMPLGGGPSGTTNLVEYEIIDIQSGEVFLTIPTVAQLAIGEHVIYFDLPTEAAEVANQTTKKKAFRRDAQTIYY